MTHRVGDVEGCPAGPHPPLTGSQKLELLDAHGPHDHQRQTGHANRTGIRDADSVTTIGTAKKKVSVSICSMKNT